jgi:carbon-monoxide dehydrogenase medium subunit
MVNFEYFAPATVEEAVALLAEHGPDAKVLAGGTDVLIFMRDGKLRPKVVVDITKIPGLDTIACDETGLHLGALATMRAVEKDAVIAAHYPHLVSSIREVGGIQIRNLATVMGNVCNSSPAADTIPPLLTMDAVVRLVGPRGERTVPLSGFFTGPGKNVMEPGELAVELTVPAPAAHTGGAYYKLAGRRAMDIAFVGVAAQVARDNGTITDVKIALGAVAPTPVRAAAAEDLLRGQALTEGLLEQAGQAALSVASPISDQRASAEYRRAMVPVLTKRMVRQAYEMAGGA